MTSGKRSDRGNILIRCQCEYDSVYFHQHPQSNGSRHYTITIFEMLYSPGVTQGTPIHAREIGRFQIQEQLTSPMSLDELFEKVDTSITKTVSELYR